MKRYNTYLSEKQIQGLEALAKATDIKVAEHIRRAIDAYLQAQKRKRKREQN